ncbi:MAG: beta-propeller fold lactonase family protein [Capsulimonas sp.]|uniref:lactonase family protein n=1 Tax=Capsulimonas sp. TaxID=2494211 RepID=UPI003264DDD7
MREICYILSTLLILLPACAFAAPALPVSMTADLDGPVRTEGQPVNLTLMLRNNGTAPIIIGGSAFQQAAFQITVTDSAGRSAPRTAIGDQILTAPTAAYANMMVIIASGKTLRYRYDLARLFDMSRPGEYQVSVSRYLRAEEPLFPPATAPTAAREVTVAAGPLKVRLAENTNERSGVTPLTARPGHQTFLYMANEDYTRDTASVYRFQVANNGVVSPTLLPPALAGKGVTSLVSTPNGRFFYAGNAGDKTVSQFQVGVNGVLSPLSPPTAPTQGSPRTLIMDPKGRFLFALGSSGSTRYTIGKDGRLSAKSGDWSQDRDHNVVPSESGAIDPTGTFLYACNGLTSAYRIGENAQVTALPGPKWSSAGPDGGRDKAIAMAPSGKFAFVLTEKSYKPGSTDALAGEKVVALRVGSDGGLTPLPGAQSPQSPQPYTPGYSTPDSIGLTVDPSGRFLVVINQSFLACYRIGTNGALTPLGATPLRGYVVGASFSPAEGIGYALNQNPPSLIPFRLDEQRGIIMEETDTARDVPYGRAIATAVAPTPEQWSKAAGGLAVSIRTPREVLSTSGPVIVTVVLKNMTSHAIPLGAEGKEMNNFQLILTGPAGRYGSSMQSVRSTSPAALLSAGHDLLETPGHSNAPVVLPPGGQRQYQFTLSHLADLTMPGDYTVQIRRVLPNRTAVGSSVLKFQLHGAYEVASFEWSMHEDTN